MAMPLRSRMLFLLLRGPGKINWHHAQALFEQMTVLQTTRGKELGGIQIMSTFVRRRIQPLCARHHPMWLYSGRKDSTRISREELGPEELHKIICSLTSLADKSEVSYDPLIEPFSMQHPRPVVSDLFIYFCA